MNGILKTGMPAVFFHPSRRASQRTDFVSLMTGIWQAPFFGLQVHKKPRANGAEKLKQKGA